MVQLLARNTKAIAWFYMALFYLNLVFLPTASRAGEYTIPIIAAYRGIPEKPMLVKAAPGNTASDNDRKKQTAHNDKPKSVKQVFTTGPSQPETQSYQSVNASNLVDLFSGDFSYNIPLLDVGGYPVNIYYQSGITMDQEASWVGLGWNINPGVISRNMRGLPDDFNGKDSIKKTVYTKPNRTIGFDVGADVEAFGFPMTASASYGLFHNTYKGWGTENSINVGINAGRAAKGPLTGSLSIANNSQTGFDVGPSMGFRLGKKDDEVKGNISIGTNFNSRSGIEALQLTGQVTMADKVSKWLNDGVSPGMTAKISFSKPSFTPSIQTPYTSRQLSFKLKIGGEITGAFLDGFVRGYLSIQEIKPEDTTVTVPAYGYLNFEKANGSNNALLDFNREKDVAFTEKAAHIAVPIYTYDTWGIAGEGTGGTIRAYRGDIGYVYDRNMSTKSNSDQFGVDLGLGNVLHTGIDYGLVYANSKSNPWLTNNRLADVIPFKTSDTTFQSVYFKNPGEKTAVNKAYQAAIGGDYLMRADLAGTNENTIATRSMSLFRNAQVIGRTTINAENVLKKSRDKRTQVVSYLTADQACAAALDRSIRSYYLNSLPNINCNGSYTSYRRDSGFRKSHHLSEITVLNADGHRYVYGVPVYNKKTVEVTLSTKTGNNTTGLAEYKVGENSTKNPNGEDGYFNKEEMPAYTHSFLLSGILSADYVDLTGNGITEDDHGDAVKFNYTQLYNATNPYKWRAPYDSAMASYNEGLKTDTFDEKGSYSYGERELWLLHSIESKTMIATFKLETDSIRKDGFGVRGENGGRDGNQKLYRLREINLYAKADLIKNGSGARPIKTVHFEYSYNLCKNIGSSQSGAGKLTLTKIWFSYNNNKKGLRNPYLFTYHSNNPAYNPKAVDRWGNYKDPVYNPGTTGGALTNADFSYTLQQGNGVWNSDSAANNAAPWTLSEIKLPSGSRIKVSYESDDYAYVQNKRAMQFSSIAGFSNNASGPVQPRLYVPGMAGTDYNYVFVKVADAVTTKEAVSRKYLEGVKQLFFKLAVNMPQDRKGKGFELVPCYAEIEDYGIRGHDTIYIKVKQVDGQSPFALAAVQFLRLNLPSKAYPYSEPGDNLDIRAAVNMMATAVTSVMTMVNGFSTQSRVNNWCNTVVTDKSFVRLDNPYYKKLGGGLRVKKVEIFDNWNKMTKNGSDTLAASVYGQTYDYTTEEMIDGVATRISSGVASYEPMIGADENPFHVPAKVYKDKPGVLAPTNYVYVEEPFAETFFPGPSIGYSEVRVQTIHKDKKSANGYQLSIFYTCKDFPTIVDYTPLDGDSKKTYNPTIKNFLSFDTKHYVTLSQGFRVELNDMNGKLKSESNFSQNDSVNPISYTKNYYRLQNDNAGQPKLSNKAFLVNSSGIIDTTGEIGKEVEVMVDVREQTSRTLSGNIGVNIDWINPFFPVIAGSVIPLPSFETNQYRSVAVTKIVNSYGLLDSVVHTEKGSKVTTRDLVYDSETGDCIVSQTNNEFDDPVYNLSYPAHWAYTGMEGAYKNIGTILKDVYFRRGIAYKANNIRLNTDRYFESGDELLVYGKDVRNGSNDHCDAGYYHFADGMRYNKIWAVNALRGKENQKGIYFIDKNGLPYSGDISTLQIIRSGKRNMASAPIGSITCLQSPLKKINDTTRLFVDSTSGVIAASAARFKDQWKVDSTVYARDTTVIHDRVVGTAYRELKAIDNYSIRDYRDDGIGHSQHLEDLPDYQLFEASSFDYGGSSGSVQHIRSWLQFNMDSLPQGSLVSYATLSLYGNVADAHANFRTTNQGYLDRLIAPWPRTTLGSTPSGSELSEYFWDPFGTTTESDTRVTLDPTTHNAYNVRNDEPVITNMAQAMLDQYYSTDKVVSPGVRISLANITGGTSGALARLSYNTPQTCSGDGSDCTPLIKVTYIPGCADGTSPTGGGLETNYICHDAPDDSIVCKPLINDTAINYYKVGILGNWRMDRAYTYYGTRKQTDPTAVSNIRTDGEIKSFVPYWSFTNAKLAAATDTSKWVWNSEMTLFNNKGYEIENHDPLNRFNGGQYGYNKTMPVVVAQNARSREVAFDGFEDYGYSTSNCNTCVFNRHASFAAASDLVDSLSHSGFYSLRVPGNQTRSATFPISTLAQDSILPVLAMKEDSILVEHTTVNGSGTGLMVRYSPNDVTYSILTYRTNIDYSTGEHPFPELPSENFYVKFNGYIQPKYSGTYTFYTTVDDLMTLSVNNVDIGNPAVATYTHDWPTAYASTPIYLEAGELYPIDVWCVAGDGDYQFKIEWESSGTTPVARETIPASRLFPDDVDVNTITAETVVKDTTWCLQFKNPTATGVINNRFSPVQGKKIVVSTWVKQTVDCITGNYNNAEVQLAFNDAGSTSVTLHPLGTIIDGWQRIEDTLTVPGNATSCTLQMKATSSAPVYFDDLRVSPFNSNIKSFVYDPVSLRLMAELDENNYATFYQYDDDGTLIRVLKETERGIKTIKETRNALLKD